MKSHEQANETFQLFQSCQTNLARVLIENEFEKFRREPNEMRGNGLASLETTGSCEREPLLLPPASANNPSAISATLVRSIYIKPVRNETIKTHNASFPRRKNRQSRRVYRDSRYAALRFTV